MRNLRTIAVLGYAALALGLVGCSGEPSEVPDERAPDVKLLSFDVTPASVMRGEAITLSWKTSDAVSIQLLAGSIPLDFGDVSLEEGSFETTPHQSTTYRLRALGANGSAEVLEQSVVVREPAPPSIVSFIATPEAFGLGGEVTLSWKTEGVSTISIADEDGRPVDLAGAGAREGAITIQPRVATSYELVAKGIGGTARATASTRLLPPPTASLSASPRLIEIGGTSTLRWETDGAEKVLIFGGEGEEPLVSGEPNGEREVSPERTTVYRLVAAGPGGEVSVQERLALMPVIQRFDSPAAGVVRPGQEVELGWAIRGATSATISNRSGWFLEVPAAELDAGSVRAPVGLGGAFVLTAASDELIAEPVTLMIPLTAEPRILETRFEPEGGVTAGNGEVATLTFAWEVQGAEGSLHLEKIPGGFIDLVSQSNRRDQIELEVEGPTQLRLSATNRAGSHELLVDVPVVTPARIQRWGAIPAVVGTGEAVDLYWETDGATSLTIERDGVLVHGPLTEGSGSFSELLAAPASYVLKAQNALGFESISEPVAVGVGAPVIVSFTSSSHYVKPGTQLVFKWRNLGGTSLQLLETRSGSNPIEICRTSDFEDIGVGQCFHPAPLDLGEVAYSLRIQNGSGSADKSLEVDVTTRPTIRYFETGSAEIIEDGRLTFAWAMEEGELGGELAELSIRDDLGRSYPLDDPREQQGMAAFAISGAGERSFTLKAEVPGSGEPVFAVVEVLVIPRPEIIALSATPAYAEHDHQEVSISWETAHGQSLEILPLSPEGVPGAASCRIRDPAEVASGSCMVRPTSETPNVLLRLTHPKGGAVERSLRIGVNPATILSFSIDDEILLRGTSTTLRWETQFSDRLELGPRFIEHDRPFVDIREKPGAVMLGSQGRVHFPAGFVFEFFEKSHESVCVGERGILSLDEGGCFLTADTWGWPADRFPDGAIGQHESTMRIAPFYGTNNHRRTGASAQQAVWTAPLQEGETGRRSFVIQWSDWDSQSRGFGFNFQVLLHDDGTMDYRYGEMGCISATCRDLPTAAAIAAGMDSLIGYQQYYQDGAPGPSLHLFPPRSVAHPRLAHRSFTLFPAKLRYARRLAQESGSLVVSPYEGREFTLIASNAKSREERTISVVVRDHGKLSEVRASPAEPLPGTPFELSWVGTDLTSLQILDKLGASVFETDDPALLEGGTVAIPGLDPGLYEYTFVGSGYFGDRTEVTIEVPVFPLYDLHHFSADVDAPIIPGAEVRLSWEAVGLSSLQIVSSREPVSLPVPTPLDSGSVVVKPAKTTTYTLIAESYGRTREASVTIEVRSVRLEEVTISKEMIFGGQPATIGWKTAGGGTVSLTPIPATGTTLLSTIPHPSELARDLYRDISGSGATQVPFDERFYAKIQFPEGFTFPWFGRQLDGLLAGINGFLALPEIMEYGNQAVFRLPTRNRLNVMIAPFSRAYANRYSSGELWWKFDSTLDAVIVQWTNMGAFSGLTGLANFQVLLYRDGSFEYRYGEMNGTDQGPLSVNFLSWQDPLGLIGYNLHFGVNNPHSTKSTAGLNRSWIVRAPLPLSGSLDITATVPSKLMICVTDDTWEECKTVELLAIDNPTNQTAFAITEIMLDPLGGAPQWFEVRNLLPYDVDMRGIELRFFWGSAATRYFGHKISGEEPVMIKGNGGYKVFSQGPMGDVPSYHYGTDSNFIMASGAAYNVIRLATPGGHTSMLAESRGRAGVHTPGVSTEMSNHWRPPNSGGSWTATLPFWCDATESYDSLGNKGTPGKSGSSCGPGSEHYDVDWFSPRPFIDLTTLGAAAPALPGLMEAGSFIQIPNGLPFNLKFFGETLSQGHPIWVSSDGYAHFAQLAQSHVPRPLVGEFDGVPNAGEPKGGILAPFWKSLQGNEPAGASFNYFSGRTGGQNVLGLQWTKFTGTAASGDLTFQIQIWENGDIVFAYGAIEELMTTGTRSTIGMQSVGGGASVEVRSVFNTGRPFINPGQSILFKRKQ